MDKSLSSPRGWSMRHGHRQSLVECCGRNSFSKSVAWQRCGSFEEPTDCFSTKPSKTKNKQRRTIGKLRHEPLVACSWLEEDSRILADILEMPRVHPLSLALAPRSLAEESDFLQRALKESEEEADLQRAIRESEEEASLQSAICNCLDQSERYSSESPESAENETLRRERLGLLRQRSTPCIAWEVADAEARMDRVYVPLTAWHSTPGAVHRRSAAAWEQAVKRATSNAERYKIQPVRTEPSWTAKNSVPASSMVEESSRTYPTVPVQGCPPCAQRHSHVLELAVPHANTGYPACWELVAHAGMHRRVKSISSATATTAYRKVVSSSSEEYRAVTSYFNATVGCQGAGIQVQELVRIQNEKVYHQFKAGERDTIMFHGCRSQQNEDSIITEGFQVKRCVSGGLGFGTWFAYGAAYSHGGGYTFIDGGGVWHLFVCVVSPEYVVLDNATMRVVGQGCAYPLWLLTYKVERLPSQTTFARKVRAAPAEQQFHVVRNGAWVLE
eukprot:TRINITY_DN105224_c0_g1_i1.p1 TRINITY_DN105224_c0_g1~~TRINITY_DN105224_c0_g1_i1.p1  ORF type:complete len:520 (-),score=63.03 TRINITY_DN105224_c0_g1_i1:339-1841(-)